MTCTYNGAASLKKRQSIVRKNQNMCEKEKQKSNGETYDITQNVLKGR